MIIAPGPEHLIWLDNEFIPWNKARLSITAHHYGIGVYEGVRSYQTEKGPAIFRMHDHTKRLFKSAHILNIPVLYNFEQLNHAQTELIRRNNLQNSYIRPFVFYDGLMGLSLYADTLQPHVMIVAAAWNTKGYHQGITAEGTRTLKLRTSSLLHNTPLSLFVKAKANGNYMNAIMSLHEARTGGADDALLLDHQGYVAEASGANIFMVRNNKLYTPEATAALPGITRDTVFILAKELGLEAHEKQITRDELYTADEVFLTGTAAEIIPVIEIDKRKISTNKMGPITEQLRQLYFAYVYGYKADKYNWLTHCQPEYATT